MSAEHVALLALLVFPFVGVAFVVFDLGTLMELWTFRLHRWLLAQKTDRTKKDHPSVVWPCPSKKGPKDQKDHASKTGNDGER